MIIDTHFHAFPGKYLELLPEVSKNDVRGVGFRAFDRQEYLDVMDRHGIDTGVLSCTAGRVIEGSDQFYPMTLKAMDDLDIAKEEKEKIYFRNAKSLFGFEGGRPD